MYSIVYYMLLIATMTWQINSYSTGLENEDLDNDYPEYSIQNGQFFVVQDQMENLNRTMYKINRSFDKVVGMSLIKTYKNVIPPSIKLALQSSINNFQEPGNIFNFLITGNLEMAINSFWRFFINSIFGIFGIFDVAAEFGLDYHTKTFESFLQKQSKSDIYFFVPILGPSTIAGAIGLLFDFIINPLTYIVPGYIYRSAFLLYVVQVKSEIFDIYNNTEKNSLDPYAAWRSYYTQYKLNKVSADQ